MANNESGDGEGDESEDWLEQGWHSETGSLFQKLDDACRNESFQIFKEEPVGRRSRVTTEDVRVYTAVAVDAASDMKFD